MTAMITHGPTLAMAPRPTSGLCRNSLAASLAVMLHVGVLAALTVEWSTEKPPVQAPRVMHTQLVMLPAPAPAPAPEPVAVAPTPEPVAVPAPVKPTVDPEIQAQKLEKAALARKRVEQKKVEQQQERLASEQQNRELEQQRQARERLSAERTRPAPAAAAPAFDSRQYQPLSKQAPDYPERALDKNIEGDCSVEYTVNTQGRVENPKVLEGCHPLFMRPSLAAANTFRYQPRMIDGKPVPVPAVRNTFHYRIK